MYCLNPIQVHIVTSHLHPDSVSTPSRSWYSCVTSIQVTYHLHPGLKMYGVPLSMPCLTSNQARWRITSIKFPKFPSQLHPGHISKPSRSQDVCLTSIQALSLIYPSYRILVSPPSKYCLAYIQVPIFISRLPPGANTYVSLLTTS